MSLLIFAMKRLILNQHRIIQVLILLYISGLGPLKSTLWRKPFRKIIDFAVKFGKMQALFNAARQAAMNQASQIQENAGSNAL